MKKRICWLMICSFICTAGLLHAQGAQTHESIMVATNFDLDSSYVMAGVVKFQIDGPFADTLRKKIKKEGKFPVRAWINERFPGYFIEKLELEDKETFGKKLNIHAYLKAKEKLQRNQMEQSYAVPVFMGYQPYILNLPDSIPDGIYSELMVFQLNYKVPVGQVMMPSKIKSDEPAGCYYSMAPMIGGGMFRILGKVGYVKEGDQNCRDHVAEGFTRMNSEYLRLRDAEDHQ